MYNYILIVGKRREAWGIEKTRFFTCPIVRLKI